MIRTKTLVLTPSGVDGSAVATYRLSTGRPGFIRAVSVDYDAAQAATTDIVVKADTSEGATLLTIDDNATDIAAKPVGTPGIDQTNAALAATDSSSGGLPYTSGIYVDIHDSDDGHPIIIKFWIES